MSSAVRYRLLETGCYMHRKAQDPSLNSARISGCSRKALTNVIVFFWLSSLKCCKEDWPAWAKFGATMHEKIAL